MDNVFYTVSSIRNANMPESNEDVHIIEAAVSSTDTDSKWTHMDKETSLRNFVRALTQGTQLLCSHQVSNGFGLSRDGRLQEEHDGRAVAISLFDIERGLPLNPPASYASSDTYIQRIQKGKIKELSVGFSNARYICDICGRDMWRDWDCRHWLGETYIIEDENGKREVIATALVKDAQLIEVSLVARAANPAAVVLKRLQAHQDAGLLSPDEVHKLQARFDVFSHQQGGLSLPAWKTEGTSAAPEVSRKVLVSRIRETKTTRETPSTSTDTQPTSAPNNGDERSTMSTENQGKTITLSIDEFSQHYKSREADLREDIAKEKEKNAELSAEIQELKPLADIGRDAIAEVRSQTLDTYRSLMAFTHERESDIIREVNDAKKRFEAMGYNELCRTNAEYQNQVAFYQARFAQQSGDEDDEPSGTQQQTGGKLRSFLPGSNATGDTPPQGGRHTSPNATPRQTADNHANGSQYPA